MSVALPRHAPTRTRLRSLVVLAASLCATAATLHLGFWQLDRAAQKVALETAVRSRAALPELTEKALAKTALQAQEQHHRTARLQGRWLAEHTVFLDNRQMNGRPGFFVLTPLQIAPGDAVLVQRGWLPRDAQDRSRLPAVATPSGTVEVAGRIAPAPARLFDFAEREETGVIRQNIDPETHARALGTALRPLSVLQLSGADPAGDGLLREWPRPALGVHKHYGYAFQWFALATLITGLYVWFQLLHPRLRSRTR